MKDKVSLKMIYLLDAKYNNGFLVLSEYNLEIGEVIKLEQERIYITMEQKKK